ncbi:MAG: S41 family peptidase [Planctomycetota bacterium]
MNDLPHDDEREDERPEDERLEDERLEDERLEDDDPDLAPWSPALAPARTWAQDPAVRQWVLAAAVAAALVFFAHQGSFVGIHRSFAASATDLAAVAEVRDLINRRWVEEPKPNQLLDGALRGMTGTLDPFSDYISAEEREQFEQSTTGRFGGLGILISVEEGVVVVISPFEDTPAWKAGILPGDRILRVDGVPCEFANVSAAVQHLKGEVGTAVTLDVLHQGEDRPVQIKVERAEIQIQSVKGGRLLERGVGYIRITSFNAGTADEVRRVAVALLEQGMKALLLDLRGNPGGLLDQAVKVANLWLPKEAVIVRTWSREHQSFRDTVANGDQPLATTPTAILLDGGSASASEVLGGALRDNGKAQLVGERSYGKGSVQTILPVLGNAAQLKLTTQYYFTPKGRRIHRGTLPKENQDWGLIPDLEVPVPQRERWRLANEEADREMERLKARARHEPYTTPERLHRDDPQARGAFGLLLRALGQEVPADLAPVQSGAPGGGVAPSGSGGVAPVTTPHAGGAPVTTDAATQRATAPPAEGGR